MTAQEFKTVREIFNTVSLRRSVCSPKTREQRQNLHISQKWATGANQTSPAGRLDVIRFVSRTASSGDQPGLKLNRADVYKFDLKDLQASFFALFTVAAKSIQRIGGSGEALIYTCKSIRDRSPEAECI